MRISKAGWIAGGVGVVAVAAVLYAMSGPLFKAREPDLSAALRPAAVGTLSNLGLAQVPQAVPDYRFLDPQGAEATLADLKGRVAVVNLWAMWCAPCKAEMPTLAELARAYPSDRVAVVTVNVDIEADDLPGARAFLADYAPLPFYRDPNFQMPFELPGKGGMPQTVLIDRQGRLRAWKTGGADWSGPEARRLVDALLAEPA